MKFKFLFLGLLAMNFVACESYEESESVAAMRGARTEYIKAQTASENADAAYRNAQVKMQELNNAVKEAQNEADIQRAKNDVEKALLELAQMKLQMEQALINQKSYVVSAKNGALSTAYGQYTTAYTEWNSKSQEVLVEKTKLTKENVELNTLKTISTDEFIPFLERSLATSEAELVAEKAVLADYKTLEPTVGAAAQLQEDKELEVDGITAEKGDVNAKLAKDNVVYAAAKTEMDAWMADNVLTLAFDSKKGYIVAAAAFNARKLDLETAMDAEEVNMDGAKTVLDLASPGDAGYNVLVETYNNAKVVFDAEKAKHDAFTLSLFNATFAVFNAKTVANDNMKKAVADQISVLDAKIAALNNEVAELQALSFVMNSTIQVGSETAKTALEALISAQQTTVETKGVKVLNDKKAVALANAGSLINASFIATTINDKMDAIAKIEADIAKLEAFIVVAKDRLDVAEAEYKTLLED